MSAGLFSIEQNEKKNCYSSAGQVMVPVLVLPQGINLIDYLNKGNVTSLGNQVTRKMAHIKVYHDRASAPFSALVVNKLMELGSQLVSYFPELAGEKEIYLSNRGRKFTNNYH